MIRSSEVPRSVRVANVFSLLLFAVGAGFYIRAWFGMREIVVSPETDSTEPWAAMARFNHFWEMSRLGIGLVLTAVAVAILSAIALVIIRRRRPAE